MTPIKPEDVVGVHKPGGLGSAVLLGGPLVCDWRMIDHLQEVVFRIMAIEAARPVAVGFRLRLYARLVALKEVVPQVDVFGAAQHNADVIQSARPRGGAVAVQGKVVDAASQINIVLIGAPFNPIAQQLRVELFATLKVRHPQGHMPQAGDGGRALSVALHLQ